MPTKVWGKPQCIVGFSFNGLDAPNVEGVNRRLANNILTYCAEYGRLPLALEWEVAHSVQWGDAVPCVLKYHRGAGRRFRTWEVAQQAFHWMLENGYERCIVVAHEDYLWRCQKVMERSGALVAGTITTALYNPNSADFWTRSRVRFVFYDRCIATPWYLLNGYL